MYIFVKLLVSDLKEVDCDGRKWMSCLRIVCGAVGVGPAGSTRELVNYMLPCT